MIVGKNITKKYGSLEVLKGVDLHIQASEVVSIVGSSGAGKTTLLTILGTLDRPTTGDILFNNINITSLNEKKLAAFRNQHIGFVFQSYNLIPVLTAKENAEFIMLLQGVPKNERQERISTLFKQVGLEDKENIRPSKLSGGQQQRVAVVRALASKPQFVLADEPTANLDTSSASNLLDIMARLNKEENMTFIFSTHDQRVIERARRIITLVDGKIFSDTGLSDVNKTHAPALQNEK